MLTIRPMQLEDISLAAELEKKCFSAPWSQKSLEDAVKKDCYAFYCAYEDEKYVGTAGLILGIEEADVTNVAVDAVCRGRGIATKLLQKLIEEARAKGIQTLLLEVREGNVPARRLYEKNSFVVDGIRKNYYTEPAENAVLMHCTL